MFLPRAVVEGETRPQSRQQRQKKEKKEKINTIGKNEDKKVKFKLEH